MSAWPESGRPRSAAQVPIKNDSLSPNKNNEKQCHDRLDIDEIAAVTMHASLAGFASEMEKGWVVGVRLSLLTLKGHSPSTFHSERVQTHTHTAHKIAWPLTISSFHTWQDQSPPCKLPLSNKTHSQTTLQERRGRQSDVHIGSVLKSNLLNKSAKRTEFLSGHFVEISKSIRKLRASHYRQEVQQWQQPRWRVVWHDANGHMQTPVTACACVEQNIFQHLQCVSCMSLPLAPIMEIDPININLWSKVQLHISQCNYLLLKNVSAQLAEKASTKDTETF